MTRGIKGIHTRTYQYDASGNRVRWIAKSIDVDGNGPLDSTTTHFVHDGQPPAEISLDRAATTLDEIGQIVLQLDETGQVQNRYLWGPAVDQILADEQFHPDGTSETLWTLTDHLVVCQRRDY